VDCGKMRNLGDMFSAASGSPHYTDANACYPSVTSLDANNLEGRDDSIAVFVGGNFNGEDGAEVEGNMVVLGNLDVYERGPGNFVSVGVGTHVLPNPGGECIRVGGQIASGKEIQVFNQASSMFCDIVYRRNPTGTENQWKTNGRIRRQANMDLSEFELMMTVWRRKSSYWATLPSTGTVEYENWGNPEGQTTYECSSEDEFQVFNVLANERDKVEGVHTIYFSGSCDGKNILINVHGGGTRAVDAAAMHWNGRSGYGPGGFPTCLTSRMLWNFPDASNVNIGNGKTSEFHGSLLVTGDLTLTTTGQSGRTIVLGDLTQNRGGSEFHSYEFNPTIDLPDPADLCVDLTLAPSSAAPPTDEPTVAATGGATENSECTAIPRTRLPKGTWNTNDDECGKCKPPGVTWWPCDQNPPLCEGNCNFNR